MKSSAFNEYKFENNSQGGMADTIKGMQFHPYIAVSDRTEEREQVRTSHYHTETAGFFSNSDCVITGGQFTQNLATYGTIFSWN